MPSPFPGMNPWLENDVVWNDFHQSFCYAMREQLVPQIRPHYYARMNEHLFIREANGNDRSLLGRADVGVTDASKRQPSGPGTALLEAPCEVTIPLASDVERNAFVEIYNKQDDELITVIELLSPTNKRTGEDREQFVSKRRELCQSSAHYIEIDLLRGGLRLPLEDMHDCDYYVMVSRRERRPRAAFWPLQIRDPLPKIPVPLRAPDADALLDLQALLHQVYDAAGYEDQIYQNEPQPRLHPRDAEWAKAFLPPG